MPLPHPAKIGLAVQSGLSIVCATCERYWEGRSRNLPNGRCTSSSNCGSPLAGDVFHDYRGPLTDFTRWCFMCGAEADLGVSVPLQTRMIGVCDAHAPVLADFRPVSMDQQAAHKADHLVLKLADGQEKRPFQLVKLSKPKTLGDLLAQTEAEWAAEAAKE